MPETRLNVGLSTQGVSAFVEQSQSRLPRRVKLHICSLTEKGFWKDVCVQVRGLRVVAEVPATLSASLANSQSGRKTRASLRDGAAASEGSEARSHMAAAPVNHMLGETTSAARRHQILCMRIRLLAPSFHLRQTLTGEDAEGFSDLCPELNLEDLSADSQVPPLNAWSVFREILFTTHHKSLAEPSSDQGVDWRAFVIQPSLECLLQYPCQRQRCSWMSWTCSRAVQV